METGILFWTFLAGLGFALSGCCIFLLFIRHRQYRDSEKAKFIMYECEERDNRKFPRSVVEI
jgi:hypothetical protein